MSYQDGVLKFHDDLIVRNGIAEASGFSWMAQRERFKIFVEYLPFHGFTILDYGCGAGQFYEYLDECVRTPSEYWGVDLNPQLIKRAINEHGRHFAIGDVLRGYIMKDYDFVCTSGTLCYKEDGDDAKGKAAHRQIISKLWDRTKRALMFNVLTGLNPEAPAHLHTIYEPEEVIDIAIELGCSKFVLRHDYLNNDMTLIMYRQ